VVTSLVAVEEMEEELGLQESHEAAEER